MKLTLIMARTLRKSAFSSKQLKQVQHTCMHQPCLTMHRRRNNALVLETPETLTAFRGAYHVPKRNGKDSVCPCMHTTDRKKSRIVHPSPCSPRPEHGTTAWPVPCETLLKLCARAIKGKQGLGLVEFCDRSYDHETTKSFLHQEPPHSRILTKPYNEAVQ